MGVKKDRPWRRRSCEAGRRKKSIEDCPLNIMIVEEIRIRFLVRPLTSEHLPNYLKEQFVFKCFFQGPHVLYEVCLNFSVMSIAPLKDV